MVQPLAISQWLHKTCAGFASSTIAGSLQHKVQPSQARPGTLAATELTPFPFIAPGFRDCSFYNFPQWRS